MPYRIQVKKSAAKEIAALPKRDRRSVVKAIETLTETPRPVGVRKLAGTKDAYRLRVGDYRIIYQIDDNVLTIFIIRVRHCKDVYRHGR